MNAPQRKLNGLRAAVPVGVAGRSPEERAEHEPGIGQPSTTNGPGSNRCRGGSRPAAETSRRATSRRSSPDESAARRTSPTLSYRRSLRRRLTGPGRHLRPRTPRTHDPRRTQALPQDPSGELGRDAAAGPRGGPGRLRQVPPHREDRRGGHGRGLARLARRPRDRTSASS